MAEDITQWSLENDRHQIRGGDDYLALRHVFLAGTLDREPAGSLPELLTRLDTRERPFHHGYGRVTDRGQLLAARFVVPRTESLDLRGRLAPNAFVDRRMVVGAKVMLAIDQGELSCLVQFIASLDVCKVCVREIPKIQSSFGSELDFSIDFDTKTLDIKYGRRSPVSGW